MSNEVIEKQEVKLPQEGGTQARTEHAKPVIEQSDPNFSLRHTPTIPDDLYQQLPATLSGIAALLPQAREKDIFLISGLTVLSGCFPNVYGVYDSRVTYPNLYSFIIAPPASGKSAMVIGRELAQKVHDEIVNESERMMKDYEEEVNIRRGKSLGIVPEASARPLYRTLYVPANSSAAAIIDQLNDNEGRGIICETEAETLIITLGQEWGQFKDILLKAFHHETMSMRRKMNNTFIEIKNPRLSLCLTGTPNQISRLIKSVHDGLFSRFVYYIFYDSACWYDVSPASPKSRIPALIPGIQETVQRMYNAALKCNITFDLTTEQWIRLNIKYGESLKEATINVSDETRSTILRLGIIHFRIAMILTLIRHFENNQSSDAIDNIICTNEDYDIADKLCDIFHEHAFALFFNLPVNRENSLSEPLQSFFARLPETFSWKQAVAIGTNLKISQRTVRNRLVMLINIDKVAKTENNGIYRKK